MASDMMIYLKYIFVLLLLPVCSVLTSCSDEELSGISGSGEKNGITLGFTLPDPIAIDPATRAGIQDFNQIKDLNIVIADEADQNIKKNLYLSQSVLNGGKAIIDEGIVFQRTQEGNPSLHFDAKHYPGKNIYALANWGKEVTVKTVRELKELKQTSSGSSDVAAGVPVGSMMFGKAELSAPGAVDMKVPLLRTVAMVTVVIDGTNLHEKVKITPTRVSLCNVPKSCFVGQNNTVEDTDCSVSGESKDAGMMWLEPVTRGKTTGMHFTTTAYNDEKVEPLFLFENYHGPDFGAKDTGGTNQKSKRPKDVPDDPKKIEAATKNCSYLKVEANYSYTETGKEISGAVAFKLFLGENITDNFDVMRNHYYKVTLKLSGMVVTEDGHKYNEDGTLVIDNKDASWRIDSHLDKVTILGGDVNLNASGDFFFLQLAGQENVEWKVHGTDSYFFLFISDPNGGSNWGNPTSDGVSGTTIPKNGIMVYCAPWQDQTFDFDSRTQKLTLSIKEDGKWKVVQNLTVTQYAPIRVKIPSASELPEGLKDFANRIMWVDRIDRKAMPWGFNGTCFATTHGHNGFENAYNLVNKQGSYYNQAIQYLPWGKNNGGSAMIYSICLNLYPSGAPSGTPDNVIQNSELPDAEDLSNRYQHEGQFVWTIPTIGGWQVIEKFAKDEIDASGFPIYSYNEYWTSNAVAQDDKVTNDPQGDKYAYYYQYGAGFDSIKEGEFYPYYSLREQPKLFRCISISNKTR